LVHKKIVVFLGGGYEANGHAPKSGIYERHFYTGFPTTEAALAALRQAVEKTPGTELIFKPHPLDPTTYSAARIQGVKVVTDVNVHALIDAADVVAAQYTTLQFEAALYDKPILALARSAWWGRDAAYEVESPEDLPAKLEAALQRRDWPAHQAHARAFITWMMDQVLVGCKSDAPARRHLRDLATFISRTMVDAHGLAPCEERRRNMEHALQALRADAASSTLAAPQMTIGAGAVLAAEKDNPTTERGASRFEIGTPYPVQSAGESAKARKAEEAAAATASHSQVSIVQEDELAVTDVGSRFAQYGNGPTV
jgi:hypothetical protein